MGDWVEGRNQPVPGFDHLPGRARVLSGELIKDIRNRRGQERQDSRGENNGIDRESPERDSVTTSERNTVSHAKSFSYTGDVSRSMRPLIHFHGAEGFW